MNLFTIDLFNNQIFNGNDEQSEEMRQMRTQIKSSFEEIGAFLLPHPGKIVAQKKSFNGSLVQIDPEFIEYVKQLVTTIFAPENLVVKKINGEKVQAKDWIKYLNEYLKTFNGDTLPKPELAFGVSIAH